VLISEQTYFLNIQTITHHLLGRARTRELPGSYPFVVQETFIRTIVKQWYGPMEVLCKAVFGILVEHVKKLVTAHFGSFGHGGLEQRVKSV